MAKQIKRVGFIVNTDKRQARAVVKKAAALIGKSGRQVFIEESAAKAFNLPWPTVANAATLARQVDLLLVFGGDGTMLSVARDIAGVRTPILGINIGSLGFLTAVRSDRLAQALECLWNGDFKVESRSLIEASGTLHGEQFRQRALNDFVISRGAASRMIELEVSVDDEILTRYRCDGLIVSSPTGSTAYSLSAGGAIVSPASEVFMLTPICPHTLSNRSVVISLRSILKVKLISRRPETLLASDGQVETPLTTGEEVVIRRSRNTLRLVRLPGDSFFNTLRHKLSWSGSNV